MSNFIEIEFPSFDDARTASQDGRPDISDCIEIADAQFRAIQQHHGRWRDGRLVIVDPSAISNGFNYQRFDPRGGVGMVRNPRSGDVQAQAQNGAGSSTMPPELVRISAYLVDAAKAVNDCAQLQRECVSSLRNGGTPQPDCGPITHCGATPLGFNTFESADYPLTGVVVGTIAQGEPIRITSGRAKEYTALWLFLSARDVANNFAEVPGYIISARINDDSQLAGDSLTNRPLDSDLYRRIGPLMLDNWLPFTNTDPDVLSMAFGHALGPAADVAFSGAFFGQATFNKKN